MHGSCGKQQLTSLSHQTVTATRSADSILAAVAESGQVRPPPQYCCYRLLFQDISLPSRRKAAALTWQMPGCRTWAGQTRGPRCGARQLGRTAAAQTLQLSDQRTSLRCCCRARSHAPLGCRLPGCRTALRCWAWLAWRPCAQHSRHCVNVQSVGAMLAQVGAAVVQRGST